MDSNLATTLAIETPRHIFELILSVIQLDIQSLSHTQQTNLVRPYRSGEFYPFHLPFGTEVQVSGGPGESIHRRVASDTQIGLYPGVEREIRGVYALTQNNAKDWLNWHQIVVNAALLYRKRVNNAANRSSDMALPLLYRTFDARLPEHALKALAVQIAGDDYYFKNHPDEKSFVRAYMDGEYYPYHLPPKTEVTVSKDHQGNITRAVILPPNLKLYPTFEFDNPDMVYFVSNRISLEWNELFRTNALPYLLARGWISASWQDRALNPFDESYYTAV